MNELNLCYSVASKIGPRPENQDNYLIRKPNGECFYLQNGVPSTSKTDSNETNGNWRFAIFDGMGGHEGGREISEKAAQILMNLPAVKTQKQLKNMIFSLHEMLHQTFCHIGAGTTLLIAEIDPRSQTALIAHVGDSRIFFRKNSSDQWAQLTEDHILVNFIARDRGQAPMHHAPQPLAQALGYGSFGVFGESEVSDKLRLDLSSPPQHRDDVKKFALEKNNQLLLATDGLWHTRQNLNLPLLQSAHSAQELIDHAESAGARDNMTALIIDIK